MNKRTMILFGTLAIFFAGMFLCWKMTSRSGYESPDYVVLDSEGSFQVREYPTLQLAATSASIDAQGEDGSFMRLFRYISGANDENAKIAMTVPVFMERNRESNEQMGFVIPAQVVKQGIPEPSNQTVTIEQRPSGRYAVLEFSGRVNDAVFASSEEQLRTWMSQQGLVASAEAEFAGYDPPWTPGPLRRNEVLIRLKDSQ